MASGTYITMYSWILITTLCSGDIIISYNLVMPNMTLRSDIMRHDCGPGALENVRVRLSYSYSDMVSCAYSDNSLPVEYTEQIRAYSVYGQNILRKNDACIKAGTCDTIDLSAWRELARPVFLLCKYCNFDEDGDCAFVSAYRDVQTSPYNDIIDSIFMYAVYDCRYGAAYNVASLDVNSVSNDTYVIENVSKAVNCGDLVPTVQHLTQNATSLRIRTGRGDDQLFRLITSALHNNSDSVVVDKKTWTVSGNYYSTPLETPTAIQVLYTCASREVVMEDTSTSEKRQLTKVYESSRCTTAPQVSESPPQVGESSPQVSQYQQQRMTISDYEGHSNNSSLDIYMTSSKVSNQHIYVIVSAAIGTTLLVILVLIGVFSCKRRKMGSLLLV